MRPRTHFSPRRQRALHSQGTRTQPHRQRLIRTFQYPGTKKPSPAQKARTLQDRVMSSKSASTSESLLETLRRVTDLFVNGAVDYSDEQIGLFDDVFQCLTDRIETSAKALLANRLAPIDNAPPSTVRTLAFDDLIEVAAPLLSRSERLDDAALIETARNKSQAHLMAISIRRVLSRAVTDVLVLRGNDEVVQSTVNNPGAEFSERGFTRLINRAEGDDDLATCLGMRPTIPRHLYLKLIAKASATVRARLEAANPRQADDVPDAVREATRLARSAPIGQETAIAHALVKSLYEDGRLDENQVTAFAEAGKFDEANAAIAALANVSVSIAENMLMETRAEGVMILAKVSGMSWSTVEAIINMRDELSGTDRSDLGACKATYERLRSSTAQQVLRFHRMQQTASSAA